LPDERAFTLHNSDVGSMWNILEALERRQTQGNPFKVKLVSMFLAVVTAYKFGTRIMDYFT